MGHNYHDDLSEDAKAGDFAVALGAGVALAEPKKVDGADYAIVPRSTEMVDLDKFNANPRRVKQTLTFLQLDSFTRYVAKWEDQDATEIFADHNSYKFKAILDYHTAHGKAGHCDHIAYYTAKQSDQWRAWTANANKWLTQDVLGDFLEGRAVDIVKPDGARVLETVMDLRASVTATFVSKSVLANGSREFAWTEDVEQKTTKGILKLPEVMTLGIPIFDRGEPYKFEVRLRFRIENGKLRFFFKIVDADVVMDQVFFDLLDKVKSQTKHLPLVAEVQ